MNDTKIGKHICSHFSVFSYGIPVQTASAGYLPGEVAGELRQALLQHRDGARVFAGTYVVTDNVLRTSEALISAFVQAGADDQLAATCSFSVTYYVLGFVMEEQALGPGSSLDLPSRKEAFIELAQKKYPYNWRARDAIFSEEFEGRFAVGLDLFIDGIQRRIHAGARPAV
ncbi:TetR/AcrR family transcriptional regulator C-terminal domain-containing protein [Enterobacter sichuanensis]|uniref:TetR/AcrR family transcriptional regulator C-terminal domain-containing protein n=1 Tax=Enterobacter sichuanensis TaxID=2071710 RepID=UPI0021CE419D|nr:TetR/AcrR family transcriptional regulator C-terminal domain-containing protein [Enterobacter sichuanensis]